MVIAIAPLVIAVVGLLMWALGNGKVSQVGYVMFCCDMLALTMKFLMSLAGSTVPIGVNAEPLGGTHANLA